MSPRPISTCGRQRSGWQRAGFSAASLPPPNSRRSTPMANIPASNTARMEASVCSAACSDLPVPPINDYNVGFDASWELDLWGKVRRQVEAADALVDQAEDQRRDALVSSLAELARDYIQLRGVQTQIRIANDNLKVDRDILQVAQQRQQNGVQNGLDVENAAAQVESIRAQLPTLEQHESQYINALSLPLDQPPGRLRAEPA